MPGGGGELLALLLAGEVLLGGWLLAEIDEYQTRQLAGAHRHVSGLGRGGHGWASLVGGAQRVALLARHAATARAAPRSSGPGMGGGLVVGVLGVLDGQGVLEAAGEAVDELGDLLERGGRSALRPAGEVGDGRAAGVQGRR